MEEATRLAVDDHDPIESPEEHAAGPTITRRGFLQTAVAAAGVAQVPLARGQAAEPAATTLATTTPRPVHLDVNGRRVELLIEPRVTLLDALRETMGLTGTKKGCDRGQCGACTVLMDGRRVNSCLTLAIMAEGTRITTVEGLASGDADNPRLTPLQAAFIEFDAFQCGFCTPGQLCSATAVVQEIRDGRVSAATEDVRAMPVGVTAAEIRERMSGNLCRCGAYPNIVKALNSVLYPHIDLPTSAT